MESVIDRIKIRDAGVTSYISKTYALNLPWSTYSKAISEAYTTPVEEYCPEFSVKKIAYGPCVLGGRDILDVKQRNNELEIVMKNNYRVIEQKDFFLCNTIYEDNLSFERTRTWIFGFLVYSHQVMKKKDFELPQNFRFDIKRVESSASGHFWALTTMDRNNLGFSRDVISKKSLQVIQKGSGKITIKTPQRLESVEIECESGEVDIAAARVGKVKIRNTGDVRVTGNLDSLEITAAAGNVHFNQVTHYLRLAASGSTLIDGVLLDNAFYENQADSSVEILIYRIREQK